MKHISLLGSAGSIGTQTLDVVRRHKDSFRVVGLSSFNEVDLLEKQAQEFKPVVVSLSVSEAADELKNRLARNPETDDIKVFSGSEGLMKVATCGNADTVVTAVVGSVGLLPTLEAIKAGKNVAVANKETLVCAGEIVMREAKRSGVTLMPIDSEHSAIFQCLNGEKREHLKRIIVTCSGGPFRNTAKEKMDNATKKEVLNHPTWTMGPKITTDCATLMNKGLEVIEAHWLYDVPYDQISVVIHPQSIIHSMVEFKDGSIINQIGVHDMRVPIQYALSYPDRFESGDFAFLDLIKVGRLDFFAPDMEKFPCLRLAYGAGRLGGTMPAVMNAANEVAVVEFFLKDRCKFSDIAKAVEKTMYVHKSIEKPSLEDILKSDTWAREHARSILDVVEVDGDWRNTQ
jgi:1-deoxy-D-xylulose-5-phosphate reductoisomerase